MKCRKRSLALRYTPKKLLEAYLNDKPYLRTGGVTQAMRFEPHCLHHVALGLLSQTKALDDRTVTIDVLLLQIAEEFLSLANHHVQTSSGVVVLGVCLQMLGELLDSGGQNRDLHLCGTGVAFVYSIISDDLLLFILQKHGVHLRKK